MKKLDHRNVKDFSSDFTKNEWKNLLTEALSIDWTQVHREFLENRLYGHKCDLNECESRLVFEDGW